MPITLRTKTLVHGNAVFPQFPGGAGLLTFTAGSQMDQVSNHPWTDILGERQGPGVVFRGHGGNRNFFHAAIPAPSVVPVFSPVQSPAGGDPPGPPHFYFGIIPQLVSFFFDVTLDQGVTISTAFAFDGATLIQASPPGPLATPGQGTTVVINTPVPLRLGLGLSFDVQFTTTGNITFHAVGAEFELRDLP
jgi:hypothetical protein